MSSRGRRTPSKRKRRPLAAEAVPAPPPLPPISPRALNLASLVVFLLLFALYLRTLMPTVVDQDCGELVSAAHVLGIPHPTGYPLWTLLARLFDSVPIGHTSAYRIALFSAVCSAAAAALICRLTITLCGNVFAGAFAGLCFGVWLPTWSQATRPEVYPLEALLFTLFLLALLKWEPNRTPRRLYWVALAAGTASMHHRTAFLAIAPALAVAFWFTRPKRMQVSAQLKLWGKAALVACAPFLFYLYLPIRAAARPPMNWGNPDSWGRFLEHASGKQYAMYITHPNSLEVALQQGRKLLLESLAGPGLKSLLLGLLGAALILWGWSWWQRRQRTLAVALAIGAVIGCLWVMAWSDISDSKVWLLPVGATLAICSGLGLDRLRQLRPNRPPQIGLVGGITVLFLAILLTTNWAACDQSNIWRQRDAAVATLSPMVKNALFVCVKDDPLFAAYYEQNVEGLHRDVTVIRPYGFEGAWYGMLYDDDLRRTGERSWRTLTQPFRPNPPPPRDLHEIHAHFAYDLAKHYAGRRTVYAAHSPLTPLPGPPYFIGLRDDLYRLDQSPPNLLRTGPSGAPVASWSSGINLLSLTFDHADVGTGDLADFTTRWRLDRPLPLCSFCVRLVPVHPPAGWDDLRKRGLFEQGFPILYGTWGLAPSPPGAYYEQRGQLIVPTNAPPGDYRLELGYSEGTYPPAYKDWTPLGNSVVLHVRTNPPPTNGP